MSMTIELLRELLPKSSGWSLYLTRVGTDWQDVMICNSAPTDPMPNPNSHLCLWWNENSLSVRDCRAQVRENLRLKKLPDRKSRIFNLSDPKFVRRFVAHVTRLASGDNNEKLR